MAKILAEEGFTSVDEIALCEIEELEDINGFDRELVSELRKRAIDEYEIQQKEIDDKNSLSNLDDLIANSITSSFKFSLTHLAPFEKLLTKVSPYLVI